MGTEADFRRRMLDVDPMQPHLAPAALHAEAMAKAAATVRAVAVPWPDPWKPKPEPLGATPSPSAPLPRADVLLVTWTAGEARTLSALLTGDNFQDWYEYRHKVADYIPNVTGSKAPFNDADPAQKRYYHSLGLYFPFSLGGVSVLAYKSGLHMAYDGPKMPLVTLWKQIIHEVQPKLVITTGTAGGIGSDVKLGDVVVAGATRFLLTGELGTNAFANQSYPTTPVDEHKFKALAAHALLKPNGDLLDTPRVPRMISPAAANSVIVSANAFAFDETTNHFGLEGLGKCCDMGDATLGLALDGLSGTKPAWHAIRNASDPQVPNPNNDMKAAQQKAEEYYSRYQLVTTAGSVVASWAAVVSKFS